MPFLLSDGEAGLSSPLSYKKQLLILGDTIMNKEEDVQKIFILDSNDIPIGYVLMGGNILYSMDDKRVADITKDMTIEELRKILQIERTHYIT